MRLKRKTGNIERICIFLLIILSSCTSTTPANQDYKRNYLDKFNNKTQELEKEKNPIEKEKIEVGGQKTADEIPDELISPDFRKKEEGIVNNIPSEDDNSEKHEKAEKVSLSLNEVSIVNIIPVFSRLLNFNFIMDPAITGAVTLEIDTELAKQDIWNIFEQILLLCNAGYSWDNGVVKIFPLPAMAAKGLNINGENRNINTTVIKLNNIPAKDIKDIITPFLSEGGNIKVLPLQNSILIVDIHKNISKIKEIVKMIDVGNSLRINKAVFKCQHVAPSQIVDEMNSVLPVLGIPISNNDKKNVYPESVNLCAVDRLSIITASAADTELLGEIKKWVKILDRNNNSDDENVYIYEINNARAEELLRALSTVFNISGSSMSIAGSASSDTAGNNKGLSAGSQLQPSSSSSKGKKENPQSIYSIPVKIFSDGINNRFIIRTKPRVYSMLRAVLDRIDTQPDQILLQIAIVEISLSSGTLFGMNFNQKIGSSNIGTSFSNVTPATGEVGGLTFNSSNDKAGLDVTLRALANKADVRILSRPQVLVESYTEAEVNVGVSVPLISNETTNTQSSKKEDTTLIRSYRYVDTGIILKIKPSATKGGLICADINQEISSAVQASADASIQSPSIRKRIIKTRLSFPNEGTIIIGGLIEEQSSENQEGLPFINNIPYISRIFGSSNISKERVELLMLINGTIISRKSNLEKMITKYRKSIDYLGKLDSENSVNANIVIENKEEGAIYVK